ncbi:peptide ABC transporter permease [Xylocopilactobacillus apicola]|uniref:Peptide ABC transporter permease n=2 Tax=Xylocopilactobacillus apicola TaxID=2932184 RepID=A0AAU9DC13_9LACO|nr:peptide ABC transporter permease [Xylocopilactobacillus apicola]
MMVSIVMLNIALMGSKLFKNLGNHTGEIVFGLSSSVTMLMTLILACYANSFILRQRIQQLGLFSVIGFSKGEIAKMLGLENLLCLLTTLLTGIVTSVGFSRLGYLILARMLNLPSNTAFGLNFKAFEIASIMMVIIFAFLMILDFIWLKRHNPIQLVRAANSNEIEPRIRWFLLILGTLSLGSGYYLALTLKNPFRALIYFFLAVLLVIIGTYFLFMAGSIFVLKLLRRIPRYYYQPIHFVGLGNLLTRLKQNGAGLASITILLTMTMMTLSTTITFFSGSDQVVNSISPDDLKFTTTSNNDFRPLIENNAAKFGIRLGKLRRFTTTQGFKAELVGNSLRKESRNNYAVEATTIKSFNEFKSRKLQLRPNEIIICKQSGYPFKELKIGSNNYRVKEVFRQNALNEVIDPTIVYLVFANENIMKKEMEATFGIKSKDIGLVTMNFLTLNGTYKQKMALYRSLPSNLGVLSKPVVAKSANSLISGALFVGCLMSFAFVLATVLILYYKQLSEGYADAKRYQTLERVGLARKEIRKTINSQLLLVFYLPLVAASVHLAVSLPMLQRIITLFGFHDQKNLIIVTFCVLLIFALFYIMIYKLTTNVYYRIVTRRAIRRE